MATSPLVQPASAALMTHVTLPDMPLLPGMPESAVVAVQTTEEMTVRKTQTVVRAHVGEKPKSGSAPGPEAPKKPAQPKRPGSATTLHTTAIPVPGGGPNKIVLPPLGSVARPESKAGELENKEGNAAISGEGSWHHVASLQRAVVSELVAATHRQGDRPAAQPVLKRTNSSSSTAWDFPSTPKPSDGSPKKQRDSVQRAPAKQAPSPATSPRVPEKGSSRGKRASAKVEPEAGRLPLPKPAFNGGTIRTQNARIALASVAELFSPKHESSSVEFDSNDYMSLIEPPKDRDLADILIPQEDLACLTRLNQELAERSHTFMTYQRILKSPPSRWDSIMYYVSIVGVPIAFVANMVDFNHLQAAENDNEMFNIVSTAFKVASAVGTAITTGFVLWRGLRTLRASINQPVAKGNKEETEKQIKEIHEKLKRSYFARALRMRKDIIQFTEYLNRSREQIETIKQELIKSGKDPKRIEQSIDHANWLLAQLHQGKLHSWEAEVLPKIHAAMSVAVPKREERDAILAPFVNSVKVIIAERTENGMWKPRESDSRIDTHEEWLSFMAQQVEVEKENEHIKKLLEAGGSGSGLGSSTPGRPPAGAAANDSNAANGLTPAAAAIASGRLESKVPAPNA